MSKWTEDSTVKFVEEYTKHDCLWNIRSVNYRNKQAKQQGLADIVSAMAITNFGIKEVESKIKSIRSTYSQELKKIKDSTRSGSGTDDIYKPNVKWFDILHQALNSVNCESRKTHSNLENNEENSVDNSTGQITDDDTSSQLISEEQFSVPNPTTATSKRRLRDLHSLVDKVSSINNSTSTNENEFDQFAKSIAGQLKAMPLLLALQAQKNIQNYISELRIQQLLNSGRTSSPMYSSNRLSMGSGRSPSPMYSSNSLTPSPLYYVDSPEVSPSWMAQNTQNVPAATLTTNATDTVTEPQNITVNPQSEGENTITMYSEAGDVLQNDILQQALASIIEDERK